MQVFVIQDWKENRAKCSLTALEGHPEFTFARLRHPERSRDKVALGKGVLLHVDGRTLDPADASLIEDGSLIVVDSTWARVSSVLARAEVGPGVRVERRSIPPGFVTAYPRTSKIHEDPPSGLASVEAVFVAGALLGEPRCDVLKGYRWAREFLSANSEILRRLCPDADAFSAALPA